ncbi:flagellin N-terminal helical domain-containing protein [Oceanimonas smirnovii]|uniref:Flagellin n=1 Tax=Oceanimonas smirnovii TaxID=264574 RepID=A0ABW7P241_9GAMM
MAITVNSNISALTAQRNLNQSSSALATSMERLSSGSKINSAKDDAAGLQISNRLNSQIKGLGVAMKNASDGISMAQTAEGAMQESTNILQRMRELALQSTNGSNSDADRQSLQEEFTSLSGELTRISKTTSFGGRNLLDGSFGSTAFQIGANANQTVTFSLGDISSSGLKGSYSNASVDGAAQAGMSAKVTGSVVSDASTLTSGGAGALTDFSGGAAVQFDLNGTTIDLDADYTDTAGVAAAIQTQLTAAGSSITATVDTGNIVLTNPDGTGVNLTEGTGSLDTVFGDTPVTVAGGSQITGSSVIGTAGDITVNGQTVTIGATDDVDTILAAIDTATDSEVTGAVVNGRIELTSSNGKNVELADATGSGGTLAALGLNAGETKAGLNDATSVTLNGTEVKFSKGDDLDSIITTINTASTGVTASKNDDGTLNLHSEDNFTVADGAKGTGLAALGLTAGTTNSVTQETTVSNLRIDSVDGSQTAIQVLDGAIGQIDRERSALGAVQNRFNSTISNLTNIRENASAGMGRIMDVDFAQETVNLTKQQILQQAGTSILAQAKQLPQAALSLLG